jgi:hypothetical protein
MKAHQSAAFLAMKTPSLPGDSFIALGFTLQLVGNGFVRCFGFETIRMVTASLWFGYWVGTCQLTPYIQTLVYYQHAPTPSANLMTSIGAIQL